MPRQSTRLNPIPTPTPSLPPYYTPPTTSCPLLRLSPELLDHILSYLLLPHSTRTTRRQLSHSLLGVCRPLTPLIRRRIFTKLSLTLDDDHPITSRDLTFLHILHQHAGVSSCVRSLRFRPPTPPEPLYADISAGGPGAALVPEMKLPPAEVVRRVSQVLGACLGLRELELELGGCGMGVEEEFETEGGEREGWKELEEVLKGCTGMTKLGVAVAHARLKLQVMAQASASASASAAAAAEGAKEEGRRQRRGYITPWLPALASWAHLTHLDLWRVRLQFPRSSSSSSPPSSDLANSSTSKRTSSTIPPEPLFSLQQVQLQSSELGGRDELLWLFGGGGGASEAQRRRGEKLEKLLIRDVEFLDTPGSAEPLLAIFPCPSPFSSSTSDLSNSDSADKDQPTFTTCLTTLVLILPHPILPSTPTNDALLSHFLTPFTELQQLELGGPGITLPLLSSLFPSSSSSPASKIHTLNLSYTPSLPIPSLLSLLSPPPSSPSHALHLSKLKTLDILRAGTHPRTWTWERISSTPTPLWRWTEGEWKSLEKVVRSIRESRRRGPAGGGGGGGGAGAETVGLRLCRDGAEVEISYDSASSSDEEDDEEEEDGEALFEPSSEPGEGVGGWAREESVESEW